VLKDYTTPTFDLEPYFLIPHNFSSFQANTSQKIAITFSVISTNHEIHYLWYSSSKVEDNIILKVCHVYKLIGVETGRLLGYQQYRNEG